MVAGSKILADLIPLGSGLGYRAQMRDKTLAALDGIDVLEVVTEQFMHNEAELGNLSELAERCPILPHGVGLSLASAGAIDWEYLERVKKVVDVAGAEYYSEHLALTRVPGIDIGHLSPVWFTQDALKCVMRNVLDVQDYLEKPLVVENISYLFDIPLATMTQGEFFHELVDATGCGLLLDLANVVINAHNHHFDACEFVDSMPTHALVQIHLAGGMWDGGVYIDSHSDRVTDETWHLLEHLAGQVSIPVSIVEQDTNFPDDMTPLLEDVAHARRIISSAVQMCTASDVHRK